MQLRVANCKDTRVAKLAILNNWGQVSVSKKRMEQLEALYKPFQVPEAAKFNYKEKLMANKKVASARATDHSIEVLYLWPFPFRI